MTIMSIKEVANKSGVSLSTVYRVIQGSEAISTETTERVRQTIKRLGVDTVRLRNKRQPNKNIKHKLIAFILIGEGAYSANLQMVRGLETELAIQDLKLVFTQAENFSDLYQILRKNDFDGVILHGWKIKDRHSPIVEKIKPFPAVWLLTHNEDWGDQVQPDNIEIGRIAANYVLQKQYSTASCILSENGNLAFETRATVFQEILESNTVKTQIYRPENKLNSTKVNGLISNVVTPLVNEFISKVAPPEALFAVDNSLLTPINNLINESSLKLERDIDVIACSSDPDSSKEIIPESKIIDMNITEIGRQAAKHLMWRIQHRDEKTRVMVHVSPNFQKNRTNQVSNSNSLSTTFNRELSSFIHS
jgi:DNA-binding LacI/PurR family transcriptional regulator